MGNDSLTLAEAWALVEILYCLLSTVTASLFTKVFLLIHRQSGIHLFNIQSNTLQLAQPCLSACLLVWLFFSSYEHRRWRGMCMCIREVCLCS